MIVLYQVCTCEQTYLKVNTMECVLGIHGIKNKVKIVEGDKSDIHVHDFVVIV